MQKLLEDFIPQGSKMQMQNASTYQPEDLTSDRLVDAVGVEMSERYVPLYTKKERENNSKNFSIIDETPIENRSEVIALITKLNVLIAAINIVDEANIKKREELVKEIKETKEKIAGLKK